MAQNFLPCDREQELLLSPSLREWLPEDHLAWFVLEAVGELPLEPFYSAFRRGGWGAAAHDPQMMVALLVYAYAIGERSSRAIERRCHEDVAFRVIAANQAPDTPRSRAFGSATRPRSASSSARSSRSAASRAGQRRGGRGRRQQVRRGGQRSGHPQLRADRRGDTRRGQPHRRRRGRGPWRVARRRAPRGSAHLGRSPPAPARGKAGVRGPARQRGKPIPRDRERRLGECKHRLEQEAELERRVVKEHEAWRERGIASDGSRRMSGAHSLKPHPPPEKPTGKLNVNDLDARRMKFGRNFLPAYNAQAVTTEDQIIVAAEITTEGADFCQLDPMVAATERVLEGAGVKGRLGWCWPTRPTGQTATSTRCASEA